MMDAFMGVALYNGVWGVSNYDGIAASTTGTVAHLSHAWKRDRSTGRGRYQVCNFLSMIC